MAITGLFVAAAFVVGGSLGFLLAVVMRAN
jgi:hypothetical protein